MPDIVTMRKMLKRLYHEAPRWKDKVNKMSDRQVLAVFLRMVDSKQIKL